MRRTTDLAVQIAVCAALCLAFVLVPSGAQAAFTTRTTVTATVTAAADWTPPKVSVTDPGASPLRGTVTLAAEASDDRSAIASVTLQVQAVGTSGWTTLCTDTTAPYSCSWVTTSAAYPDDTYLVRATATDRAENSATSTPVQVTVANSFFLGLTQPADLVRGQVPLTATLYNNLLPYKLVLQYAEAGTGSWKPLCSTSGVAYTLSCSWDTTASHLTQGASYDLRAVATALGITVATSPVASGIQIDNVAPIVTMTNPGTPLRGSITLNATATDAESGVAQVQFQILRSGTSSWVTVCTASTRPYSCRFDTTSVIDGSYSVRAIATDSIGNATTSAAVSARQIDNVTSSVSVDDPGSPLSGRVSLTARAASTAGITSVRIERSGASTSTWTTLCTLTSAPYTCSWDTTASADGSYDLRAVLTDRSGATTTSSTVAARIVNNISVRAADVQATPGPGTDGQVDEGDSLTLTYSGRVATSSLLSGWQGASTPIGVRLRDGDLVGSGAGGDTLDVVANASGSAAAINLGTVNLGADYLKANRTALYSGTMTAATTTVDGVTVTVITVTIGAPSSVSGLVTVTGTPTMIWTPSAAAKDLTGTAVSTASVSESGRADQDF